MAGDFLVFDPYVQALIGTGFKDEDFAENTGMNLAFNGLLALRATGQAKGLREAL